MRFQPAGFSWVVKSLLWKTRVWSPAARRGWSATYQPLPLLK